MQLSLMIHLVAVTQFVKSKYKKKESKSAVSYFLSTWPAVNVPLIA